MNEFKASITELNAQKIKGFKAIDLEYWYNPSRFSELIENQPIFESMEAIINTYSPASENRDELCQILLSQHLKLNNPLINERIRTLQNKNTFTVISAHQPLLFGGALYWWYKIAHTIGLCNELNTKFPDYNFVAIHYAGTEDHDFEEINHLSIFNKRIEWKNDSQGANGRRTNIGLKETVEEIKVLFQNDNDALAILDNFLALINESQNYNDFHQQFFYNLFEKYNILYFNPDEPNAKKLFSEFIEKELDHNIVKTNSEKSIISIKNLGYEPQAYTHDINLFYLRDQYRTLIQKVNNQFITKDKKYQWTESQLKNEMQNTPEHFSPNVVFRPLFQEFLFPNLIFVGGGAEIAYWMQLKDVFINSSIPYPILWRRFSAIIYSQQIQTKIKELGLEIEDFHESSEYIFQKYLTYNSNFKALLEQSSDQLMSALNHHQSLSFGLEKSIENSITSDIIKLKQQVDQMNSKLIKAEKQKHENVQKKIEKIKEQLYPQHNLQERTECGIQYYLQYGPTFIEFLINNSNHHSKALGFLLNS